MIWRPGIRKISREAARLKVLTPAKVLMSPLRKELERIPSKSKLSQWNSQMLKTAIINPSNFYEILM